MSELLIPCTFPAKKWLTVKRMLAELADEHSDWGMKEMCMRMVMNIDRIGRAHTNSGCDCWMEAGQTPNRAFSINDAAWLLEINVRL